MNLKPKEYYIDLYDRLTIDRCRQWERICKKDDGKPMIIDGKELDKDARLRFLNWVYEFSLHYMTGEEYVRKEDTITKWMDRDKERDSLLESTEPPRLIKCKTCFREMGVESKHLWGTNDDRVMFMFVCPNECLPNRAIFENGEEWKHEPDLCPKCKLTMTRETTRNNDEITTTYKCSCGYVIIDNYSLSSKKEAVDPNFEQDRVRFCLSLKDGVKFLEEKRTLEDVAEFMKNWKKKDENKELYDKAKQLKKLGIPQLKEHVISLLKDEIYTNLVFEKPDMGIVVSLGFSTEDPTDQSEYNSRQKLSKIFKKGLEETNWRLMSEGIHYRLGVLTGRLRVYEKEEDLVKLVTPTKTKKDSGD
jgi:hypothetical protein